MANSREIKTNIPGVAWRRETRFEAKVRSDAAKDRLETATAMHISAMDRFAHATSQDVSAALVMQRQATEKRANAVTSKDLDPGRKLQLHLGSYRIPFVPDLRSIIQPSHLAQKISPREVAMTALVEADDLEVRATDALESGDLDLAGVLTEAVAHDVNVASSVIKGS